jgi:hypothetical protein
LRQLGEGGEEVPFSVGRGDEDLLPWAITDNGDVRHWAMSRPDEPDNRTVVVTEACGPQWFTTSDSVAEFLVGVLSGSLVVSIFPDDVPSSAPQFTPLP